MKKQKRPYTQLTTEDGILRYAGVANDAGVHAANGREVIEAFHKLFKDGDILDVQISRRIPK